MMDDEITLHSSVSLDIAHNFLDEHGKDIHSIFDGEKVNSPEQTPLIPPGTFSSTTKYRTEQFLESMDKHKDFLREIGTGVLDLRSKHSWDDMIKAAEDAQQAYEAAGNVTWRKTGRYISARAEMLLPYTRLIPNESYTSILYGGLRLVFEAIARVDERRSKVVKALFRIPKIIILAEECVRIFPLDVQLYAMAEEVFVTALPAIEGTIKWLKQHPTRKQMRALFKGPMYSKNYTEKIQNLDDALVELKERVLVLNNQSVKRTEAGVENVQHIVNRNDTQLHNIAQIQNDVEAKVDSLANLEEVRKAARDAMRIVLEEKLATAKWMKEKDRAIRRLKNQMEELQKAAVSLTPGDLLDIIDVVNVVQNDFRHMQQLCRGLDLPQIEITQGIIQGDKMSEWIDQDASSVLFVEGEGFAGSIGRVTPTTLLSTEVVNSFSNREPAVPIYYFCGMHTSARDGMQGPVGLMRSLIWQVVQLCPPNLDFISRRIRQQLEALHLHTLCDCFCKLVSKLPSDMVLVCVIDGFAFFEKKEWAEDCREVIIELLTLLEDDNVRPVFKLLITSPARSRYVRKIFPDEVCITMMGDRPNSERHSQTERHIAVTSARSARAHQNRGSVPSSLRGRQRSRRMPDQELDNSWCDSESDTDSMTEEQVETRDASEMEIDSEKAASDHRVARPH